MAGLKTVATQMLSKCLPRLPTARCRRHAMDPSDMLLMLWPRAACRPWPGDPPHLCNPLELGQSPANRAGRPSPSPPYSTWAARAHKMLNRARPSHARLAATHPPRPLPPHLSTRLLRANLHTMHVMLLI